MSEAEQVHVSCTQHCGFSVSGPEKFCSEMFGKHEHQEDPGAFEPAHWYEHAFSLQGVAIVFIVALTVAFIVRGNVP